MASNPQLQTRNAEALLSRPVADNCSQTFLRSLGILGNSFGEPVTGFRESVAQTPVSGKILLNILVNNNC